MEPTFWLLVSFTIFVSFIFLKLRKTIVALFFKYKNDVLTSMKEAEDLKLQSKLDLEEATKQVNSFKLTVEKIKSTTTIEIERIENEAKNRIAEYAEFKERSVISKLEIVKLEEVEKLKTDIFNKVFAGLSSYYKNSQKEKIDLQILNSIKENVQNY